MGGLFDLYQRDGRLTRGAAFLAPAGAVALDPLPQSHAMPEVRAAEAAGARRMVCISLAFDYSHGLMRMYAATDQRPSLGYVTLSKEQSMSAFTIDLTSSFPHGAYTGNYGGPQSGGHRSRDWFIEFGMDLGAAVGVGARRSAA